MKHVAVCVDSMGKIFIFIFHSFAIFCIHATDIVFTQLLPYFSAITVRDKLESLCRELQRQNKILMVSNGFYPLIASAEVNF